MTQLRLPECRMTLMWAESLSVIRRGFSPLFVEYSRSIQSLIAFGETHDFCSVSPDVRHLGKT